MSKPKAPTPPDPKVTAAAQTGTNVSTAIANAALGNVNQVTPDGRLDFSTDGYETFKDPTSGATYQIPKYTATQTLSQNQQAIKDANDAASYNLGNIAKNQSYFLNDYLSKPVTGDGLPAGGDASKITSPNYQQFGFGPQFQSELGAEGSSFRTGIGNDTAASSVFGNAGPITRSYGEDFSADRQRVEDAMFTRLNPQMDRDRASLQTSLANQGIRQGSTAWSSAMDDFNRGVSDQRTSITLAGGQEQSRIADLEAQRAGFQNAAQAQEYQQQAGRGQFANAAQAQNFGQDTTRAGFEQDAQGRIFDQNLSRATFGNAARQQTFQNAATATEANNNLEDRRQQSQLSQFGAANAQRQAALGEMFGFRNQPINEISALMSGSQVSSPNFVGTNQPTIPTVDYAGLVNQNYQNQLGIYNQQAAQSQGLLGGLFGLGSSAIMASDSRLKTNVRRVGDGPLGLPVYAFRYVWGGPVRIGFMAQDVLKVLPSAVLRMANGFLAVDYDLVFRVEGA